jgi:hypothetical protein
VVTSRCRWLADGRRLLDLLDRGRRRLAIGRPNGTGIGRQQARMIQPV